MDRNTHLMTMIRSVVVPATGCTEPVAIALNAATARAELQGQLKSARVLMDICLLKNALGVGIPGFEAARGVVACVAVGIAAGDPKAGMNVLGHITPEGAEEAVRIMPLVDVQLDSTRTGLFIETVLESDCDSVRVITDGGHANITRVEHGRPGVPYDHYETVPGSTITPVCTSTGIEPQPTPNRSDATTVTRSMLYTPRFSQTTFQLLLMRLYERA